MLHSQVSFALSGLLKEMESEPLFLPKWVPLHSEGSGARLSKNVTEFSTVLKMAFS